MHRGHPWGPAGYTPADLCQARPPGADPQGMRWRCVAALGICMWLATGPVLADAKLYRPAHRLAGELAPLARAVLAPDGSATVDPGTGALLLQGEPGAIEQALAVLRQLDVPLRSFRVESLARSERELSAAGLAVEGWIDLGGVRVGHMPGDPVGLRVRAGALASQGASRFEATLTVRDGSTADLWTGRAVPAANAVLEDSERRVLATPPLRAIRSGFRVRPRGLADGSIELWIQPILARDSLQMPVEETGARSRISVRPGEWLVLGRIEQSTSGEGTGIGALASQRGRRQTVLLVRVSDAPGASGASGQ